MRRTVAATPSASPAARAIGPLRFSFTLLARSGIGGSGRGELSDAGLAAPSRYASVRIGGPPSSSPSTERRS